MIVGLCGTHGTGKSTILEAMVETCKVSRSQLAREAQAMLGWDRLSKAEESIENMWLLQEAVLAAMYDRDQAIIESREDTVAERTPADVWAYTRLWCQRLGIDSTKDLHAVNYKSRCIHMAMKYGKFIFVPQSEKIPFVEQPARADLASRQFVNDEIYAFLWDGMYPYYQIKTTSRFDRAEEVNAIIKITLAGKE